MWEARPGGRRALAALLRSGAVRVNGRRVSKGTLLRKGDEVTIANIPPPALPPEDGPLVLLHVDARIVVADKPPGLPTVAGRQGGRSVASILLARFPEMAAIDPRRAAGLVHRLDTGTSGFLLAARDTDTHARFRAAFAAKAVEKTYYAVVLGRLSEARVVDQALARRSACRMRPARPSDPKAWPARTEVEPLRTTADLTLVRLRMRTGVTHQLRVHLASLGHPIVGDRHYGPPDAQAPSSASAWHYLHARTVRSDVLQLPAKLVAPIPVVWQPLFRQLGWPIEF